MIDLKKISCAALVAAFSFAPAAFGQDRVYDPVHKDYHVFDQNERAQYAQWARENHYDEHRDYRQLDAKRQKEYWKWRHQHENDHHDDHGRH
jgi:hypothetical protein